MKKRKDKFVRYFIEICFSIGIFGFFTSCLKDLYIPVCYFLGYIHCVIMHLIASYLDLKKDGVQHERD